MAPADLDVGAALEQLGAFAVGRQRGIAVGQGAVHVAELLEHARALEIHPGARLSLERGGEIPEAGAGVAGRARGARR